ncbi:MAG TPA: cytidine deaminase [Chthonomonadales bacterium]|nr:cytidine deaminase [Chthonomonadales bacterium]
MLSDPEVEALVLVAAEARRHAYAPYSGFRVGAAVVADDDTVYAGCNVESASYGLSLCAERSAIARAIAAGRTSVRAVVVVSEAGPDGTPCGACRQWLAEFGRDDLEVVCAAGIGERRVHRLADLLPHPFRLPR